MGLLFVPCIQFGPLQKLGNQCERATDGTWGPCSQVKGLSDGSATAYPAADTVPGFVYLDVVAFLKEELGGAETRDTSSDDGDFRDSDGELVEDWGHDLREAG